MSISGAPLHTEIIHLRVPAGMTAALQYVARKRAQRMPELIRQELLDRLVAEGWAIDAAGRITDTGQPT